MQLIVLEAIFEREGFEVVMAINGQEAYQEVLKATALNRIFDLIVLDLCMPVTDGYEACSLIVDHFKSDIMLTNSLPKIIAVSGFVDLDVEIKTAKCGFKEVFPNPLGVPEIRDFILPDLQARRQEMKERSEIAEACKNSSQQL